MKLTNLVVPGVAGRSFGVELAEFCQAPAAVLASARQWRDRLCQDMTHSR